MYQPAGFGGDPLEAYWHLVNAVTLWDVGTERQVEITGPRCACLHRCADAARPDYCPVGRCRYALVTSQTGGIVNDPVLLRLAENHFWLSTLR